MGPIRSMGRFSRFRKIAPVTMPPPGMPGAAMDMIVEIEITIAICPTLSCKP